MEIIKKNITSIICGVIAILAVVMAFYPTDGYFDTLKDQVKARSAKYQTLASLLRTARFFPNTSIDEQPPQPMTVFPNQATIDQAHDVLDRADLPTSMKNQASELVNRAEQLNQAGHVLLTPDALPEPNESAPFRFQQQNAVEYARLRDDVLKGCQPPSSAEIEKKKADLTEAQKSKYIYLPDGKPANQAEVDAETAAKAAVLADELRQQAAQTHQIYLDPEVLQVPAALKTGRPFPNTIWACQSALWVAQDVCAAIAKMNAGQNGIQDNPVKRLIKLDVDLPELGESHMAMGGMGMDRGQGQPGMRPGPGAPAAAGGQPMLDMSVPLPKSPASPTQRVSNGLYDVVTFHLVVCVDANKIEPFLQTLQAGHFICVRNVNEMRQIDTAAAAKGAGAGGNFQPNGFQGGAAEGNGYIYGPQPVAQLDLSCEELFMRSWTYQWMPATIRENLPK